MKQLSAALLIVLAVGAGCDDDDEGEPIFPADGGIADAAAGADVMRQPDAGRPRPIDAGENIVIVTLDMDRFMPMDITVARGTTVRWVNEEADLHTVTNGTPPPSGQDGNLFDANLNLGDTFEYTFNSAGDFPYFCRLHFSLGMVGSVTVTP